MMQRLAFHSRPYQEKGSAQRNLESDVRVRHEEVQRKNYEMLVDEWDMDQDQIEDLAWKVKKRSGRNELYNVNQARKLAFGFRAGIVKS